MAILSGALVLERLILEDATFALERRADGTANWTMGQGGPGPGLSPGLGLSPGPNPNPNPGLGPGPGPASGTDAQGGAPVPGMPGKPAVLGVVRPWEGRPGG